MAAEHAPHVMEDGLVICGGTDPSTTARLIGPLPNEYLRQVLISILRPGTNPHVALSESDYLFQGLLDYDGRLPRRKWTPEFVSANYIARALEHSPSVLGADSFVNGVLPRREIVTIEDDDLFGPASRPSEEDLINAQRASLNGTR